MTLNMLIGILEQGLIYGIMAMGLLITYRILDFPDLTVDSSFPLGAAVSATLTLQGVAPWLTLLIGCAAGGIAGLITGLIHVKCRVRDLLSGIITMTGLYSINLHIAQNKANLPLFGGDTLFRNAFTKSLPKAISPYTTLIIILLIALIAKILLDLFLRTKCGYLLRAAGDNPSVVTTLSRDQGTVKILGLIIANALVALAGAVMCQQQRFLRHFDGHRHDGRRACVRHHRHKPLPPRLLPPHHHHGADWFDSLQGVRVDCDFVRS